QSYWQHFLRGYHQPSRNILDTYLKDFFDRINRIQQDLGLPLSLNLFHPYTHLILFYLVNPVKAACLSNSLFAFRNGGGYGLPGFRGLKMSSF
ncbi:MAG: hypothetical protein WCL16_14465, partial [bacterium]